MSGPLVTMAVLDAYGAGFEYTKPAFVRQHHKLDKYIQHPKWKENPPGSYTDDTQMALALGELMAGDKDPSHWTTVDVAQAFVSTFCRDPRPGYAAGFYQLLKHLHKNGGSSPFAKAVNFLSTVEPHSRKNGGAMRAGILGLLPGQEMVVDLAMFQASLTHATREGMGAAAAAALMTHYCHYRLGPKSGLPEYLHVWLPGFQWTVEWRGRVNSPGSEAVRAALTAVLNGETLIDVLRISVDFGGDVDTVAAIAGCAASRCEEIAQFLPRVLHDQLENGDYGRDYLAKKDQELLEKFPSPEDPEESEDLIGEVSPDLWD